MDYLAFLNTVKREVQLRIGNSYICEVRKVLKNNGVILDGLFIIEKQSLSGSTIYLNSYYEQYRSEMTIEEITEDVLRLYLSNTHCMMPDLKWLENFRELKETIVYKLIHRESNRVILNEIPHFQFQDLAIVFYLVLDENEDGHQTLLIQNNYMEIWKTSREELLGLAKKNTPDLLPVQIKPISEALGEIIAENVNNTLEYELLEHLQEEKGGALPLYVMSNTHGLNGAACMIYDGALSTFADEKKSDIIILPSSIHEILLMPDDMEADYKELRAMVRYINQNEVQEEDRLSDEIYRYERSSDSIRIVECE